MIFKSKINTFPIKISYTTPFLASILFLKGMATKCISQAHNINESSINYIKNTKTHVSIL